MQHNQQLFELVDPQTGQRFCGYAPIGDFPIYGRYFKPHVGRHAEFTAWMADLEKRGQQPEFDCRWLPQCAVSIAEAKRFCEFRRQQILSWNGELISAIPPNPKGPDGKFLPRGEPQTGK